MTSLFETDRPLEKVFLNNDAPSNMQQYHADNKSVFAKQMTENFFIINYSTLSSESGKAGDYVVQENNNLTLKKRKEFEEQFTQ